MKYQVSTLLVSAALGAWGGSVFRASRAESAGGSSMNAAAAGQRAASAAGAGGESGSGTITGGAGQSTAPPKPTGPRAPRPTLEELKTAPREERVRLLVRWLPESGPAEIAALAEEWFSEANTSGDEAWQTLVLRWVEIDSRAAMEYSRKITKAFLARMSSSNTMTPLDYAYHALGRVDPDQALSLLAGESPALLRRVAAEFQTRLGAEKMRQWALSQPERADLDFLRKTENGFIPVDLTDPAKAAASLTAEQRKYQLDALAEAWAQKDPDAAVAWAQGLENPLQKSKAMAAMATALAKTNPAKALEIIATLPAGPLRAHAATAYVAELAKSDPQAAMTYLDTQPRGVNRLQGIAAIAAARAAADPAGALRLLRENGVGDLRDSPLSQVIVQSPNRSSFGPMGGMDFAAEALKSIAAKDPAGVMQLLADTGSIHKAPDTRDGWPSQKGNLARTLFNNWMNKDPVAAAKWAAGRTAGGGEGLNELAQSATGPWFAKDPDGVRTFAASLPDGPGKDRLVQATATLMGADDPAGAFAWTAQNGSPEALGSVLQTLAQSNPQLAVGQFASLPPAQQEAQLQKLTDNLSQSSPSAAMALYGSLSPERQATVKLRNMVMAYARQDPQEASAWVTTLPPTEARDTAISGLVDYLIQQSADPDPESAAHWAAASLDANGRGRRLERVAEAWFKLNPGGAADAIQAASLPDEVKQTLLRHAPVKK